MEAVTRAGGNMSQAKAGVMLALACGSLSAMAQTPSYASPMDRIEQLMREQQAAHSQHGLQIQSLRQQFDHQAIENQAQDWQWASGLAGALLMAMAGVWLLARWPAWRLSWQQKQAQRASKHANPAPAKHSLPPENLAAAFEASGLQSGAEIDHSGQGMVKHLLRQKKLRQKKRGQRMSEPAQDSEWLVQLDEMDSQFLADDALREYELRKTVGLISQDDQEAHAAAAKQRQAVGVDDMWHSLQEVALDFAQEKAAQEEATQERVAAKTAEPAKAEAMNADVSEEVQRVRKALHERRQKRNLQALAAPSEVMSEPRSEPTSKPIREPQEELVLSYVQEQEQKREPEPVEHYSPSVRAMSDAETRLALAQEFEKLGALDEAAQLCEEVMSTGSFDEQTRARKHLNQLPGR